MGTYDGVLKSLEDIPLHCGLNNTCSWYDPAGKEMVTTVTPSLGWSGYPSGVGGSVEKRSAFIVVIVAPLGGVNSCIVIFWPSSVRVADVPPESMLTVALVCIRHIMA